MGKAGPQHGVFITLAVLITLAARDAMVRSSSVSGSRRSACSSASRISIGMARNGIRPSRKAATANSLAAFTTALAAPPLRAASKPSARHGKRSVSAGSKSSRPTPTRSSGETPEPMRSGQVWVQDDNGDIRPVNVRLGIGDDSYTQIAGRGIEEGVRVLTRMRVPRG